MAIDSWTYACNLFDWYLKVQETLPLALRVGAVGFQRLHHASAYREPRAAH